MSGSRSRRWTTFRRDRTTIGKLGRSKPIEVLPLESCSTTRNDSSTACGTLELSFVCYDFTKEAVYEIMGVVNSECKDHVSAMTTAKPRERQFQVVPVPGRFTRGRWTCWDYKDADTVPSNTQDPNIIEYSENKEKEKDDSVSPKASNAVPADTPLTAKFTVGDIPEIAVEPSVSTAPISMNVTAPMDVPGAPRESSTILVTSVAVAPSTPVHGTPSSLDVGNILDDNRTSLYPQSPSELVQQATVPMVEIGINSAAPLVFDDSSSIMLSPPLTGSNAATVSSTSSLAILGGVLSSQATVSSPTSIATNIASPPAVLSSVDTSQASATTLAQPSPLSSFTETTQSATSIKAPSEGSIPDESSPASNVGTGPSVVAIDNKIEQAMDLVKTHLTYAVREEVDILRTTITELEEKVTQLENQNQVLKQFAPPEVLANLSFLVQNAQAQKQLQQQAQQLISPVPSQPQLLPLSSQPLSTASVITALPKPTALNTSQVNATSATQQSMPLSKSPPTDLARTVEQSMVTTAGDGYFSVLSPSSTPSLASATVADPSISYVSPSNLSAAEAANTVNSAIP